MYETYIKNDDTQQKHNHSKFIVSKFTYYDKRRNFR